MELSQLPPAPGAHIAVIEDWFHLVRVHTQGVILSAPDANGYRTAWFSGGGPNRFMRLAVSH